MSNCRKERIDIRADSLTDSNGGSILNFFSWNGKNIPSDGRPRPNRLFTVVDGLAVPADFKRRFIWLTTFGTLPFIGRRSTGLQIRNDLTGFVKILRLDPDARRDRDCRQITNSVLEIIAHDASGDARILQRGLDKVGLLRVGSRIDFARF